MRLPKSTQKIKAYFTHNRTVEAVFIGLSIFLISTALYQTWQIGEQKAMANKVFDVVATKDLIIGSPDNRVLVASKKGSVYYFPACSGAKRIKEADKIWFASEEEAREGGYRPAKNCKAN